MFPSDAAIEAYVRTQLAGVVANGSADAAAGGYPPVYSQTQLLVDTGQFIAGASTTALAPGVRTLLARAARRRPRGPERRGPPRRPGLRSERHLSASANTTSGPHPALPCPFPKFLKLCDTDPPVIKCDRFNSSTTSTSSCRASPRPTKTGTSSTSLDPNDKVGPGGPGGFIDGADAAAVRDLVREPRDRHRRRVRGDGHRSARRGEVRPRHVQSRTDHVRRRRSCRCRRVSRASRPRSISVRAGTSWSASTPRSTPARASSRGSSRRSTRRRTSSPKIPTRAFCRRT